MKHLKTMKSEEPQEETRTEYIPVLPYSNELAEIIRLLSKIAKEQPEKKG